MEYRIKQYSEIGLRHKMREQENQDYVCSRKNGNHCSICLADGAGSRMLSAIGAKYLCEALAEYLTEQFAQLCEESAGTLRAHLVQLIQDWLQELAIQYRTEGFFAFGSTLLFAATDGTKYLIGHLGDGVILGLMGGQWCVMSFPENGRHSNETYLTTSYRIGEHLRLQCGDCNHLDGFLMASDGILPAVFENSFLLRQTKPLTEAFKLAMNEPHQDDASYIFMNWR